ncbi:MAG: 3-methyl-2-oxobutanoate hydroxymethyltransferase [Promethearchaeota archaeon]
MSLRKMTIKKLIEKKRSKEKIVALTAYDYSMAKLVDACGIDFILVGDSLSMVMLGNENTLAVTLDEMIHHTKAVSRGVSNALIVGDMPFLTYKIDMKDAIYNAGRFIQEGGAEAVKIEGGTEVCPLIKRMIRADIQVMGHVGLTPQAIYEFGGFMVQGKTVNAAKKIITDVLNLQKSGVFSIVLESIPWQLAKIITNLLDIPTIGIGAGPYCDGQILVLHDMLGIFTEFKPKFLKYFGNIGTAIKEAINGYKQEVETEKYPTQEYSYDIQEDEFKKIQEWVDSTDLEKEADKVIKEL